MPTFARLLLIPLTTLLSLALLLDTPTLATPAEVGDPIPRIDCSPGYSATIFTEGLSGPDGLALDPISGDVFVAEEGNGRVSRIPAAGGTATPIVNGLVNPEGIAFDPTGNLYVVEDTADGRLIRYDTSGITTTLAISLTYPEGVTVGSDGHIYITESELETFTADSTEEEIRNLEARVSAVAPTAPYTLTNLIVITPTIQEDIISLSATGTFTSFAGITQGSDGLLYVSNELSGVEIITTTEVANPFPIGPSMIEITAIFTSTDSILTIDPQSPDLVLFNSELTTPEGIRFDSDGNFPLYVAEEDISAEDDLDTGRLSLITDAGTAQTFCTGFLDIEDVLPLGDGSVLVSEDTSGLIVRLTPPIFYDLDITLDGAGAGTVSSEPAGITCGTACSAAFEENTAVTLTATANAGSAFANWGGACAAETSSACTITMDAAQTVSATFTTDESSLLIYLPYLSKE